METDAGRFLRTVAEGHFDVVLLDCDSDRSSTDKQLELYDGLGDCKVPIVVMTDDTRRSTAIEFLQRGAYDCVRKPPSILELKVILRRAYEHHLMKLELVRMRETMRETSGCDQLTGSSGRSQVVYELIRRVTNLNAFVLITGESGTGKELVARAVHNLGNRAGQPFVAVSCGAILETHLGPLRIAPIRRQCESVLELPPRCIFDSGTRIGY
ncbi:MAG: sigma 54-interacting transcriptional regulator, partial [Candidatus Omnitrophica bacterium]|nr:sigma 54-interacting transcriptional regulator [Candidatus Omnitrophota bacterium]